ncbi:MAG: HEAT repeat domain-containing protein [Polyangiaceae bacterium]
MFGVQSLARNLGAALRDLRDPKPKVRVSAAQDLARHLEDDRERVVEGLLGALDDDAVEVRTVVAELLGDAKATEALTPLMALMDHAAAPVREAAIRALGAIGDAKAAAKLERGTRDARPDVRFQSVMAYARVAPREDAVKALVQATHDDDEFVAHIALRMGEEIADREGEGALRPAWWSAPRASSRTRNRGCARSPR